MSDFLSCESPKLFVQTLSCTQKLSWKCVPHTHCPNPDYLSAVVSSSVPYTKKTTNGFWDWQIGRLVPSWPLGWFPSAHFSLSPILVYKKHDNERQDYSTLDFPFLDMFHSDSEHRNLVISFLLRDEDAMGGAWWHWAGARLSSAIIILKPSYENVLVLECLTSVTQFACWPYLLLFNTKSLVFLTYCTKCIPPLIPVICTLCGSFTLIFFLICLPSCHAWLQFSSLKI